VTPLQLMKVAAPEYPMIAHVEDQCRFQDQEISLRRRLPQPKSSQSRSSQPGFP
jgi:hypothetical protein